MSQISAEEARRRLAIIREETPSDDEPEAPTFAERIREWDDEVEESDDQSNARDPFDGGVMLAIAGLFEAIDGSKLPKWLEQPVKELRETVEQVIA